MTKQPPDVAHEQLGERIAADLRRAIRVQRAPRSAIVAQPGFWNRCRLVNPDSFYVDRIFVDGFAGTCYWNSLKVFDDELEVDLTLWCGYAFTWDRWLGHAWCMLGNRIVESTGYFAAYFGAELHAEEVECLRRQHQKHDLFARDKLKVYTFINGHRDVVDYDPTVHAQTIGRERDPQTGEIKPGLGR